MSYSEECDPGTNITEESILEAVGSATSLLSAIFMNFMEKTCIRGLPAFDLARQRLRINIKYLIWSLLIMVSVTSIYRSCYDGIRPGSFRDVVLWFITFPSLDAFDLHLGSIWRSLYDLWYSSYFFCSAGVIYIVT